MSESKKVGPELIASILREAKKPLTTRQLQQEVQKLVPFCLSDNVIALNLMRVRGTIKGKLTENRSWSGGSKTRKKANESNCLCMHMRIKRLQ